MTRWVTNPGMLTVRCLVLSKPKHPHTNSTAKICKKHAGSRFFYCRIGDSLVVHLLQTLLEHPLDRLYLLDGYIRLDQLGVRQTLAYNRIHQIGYTLRRIVLQRAGSRFYGVRHKHYDLFLAPGQLTVIHKRLLIFRVSAGIAVLGVKIEGQRTRMMSPYKICHDFRKLVPAGYLDSVINMTDNLLRAFLGRESLMIVESGRSILHKALGILHLTYVVIECPYSGQRHIGTYLPCRL